MDYRRLEPRFGIDQPVQVTSLEDPGMSMRGFLVNFSAKGTRLIVERYVRPGTMVKVEWGGTILLGEIMYCAQKGSKYAAGLELEDALYESELLSSMAEMGSARLSENR